MRLQERQEYFKLSEENWLKPKITTNEEIVITEKKKRTVVTFTISNSLEVMHYSRSSKFSRFVNIVRWMKRFMLKCRCKNKIFPSVLSIEEKEIAEKVV